MNSCLLHLFEHYSSRVRQLLCTSALESHAKGSVAADGAIHTGHEVQVKDKCLDKPGRQESRNPGPKDDDDDDDDLISPLVTYLLIFITNCLGQSHFETSVLVQLVTKSTPLLRKRKIRKRLQENH
jgi:hypothetical protein